MIHVERHLHVAVEVEVFAHRGRFGQKFSHAIEDDGAIPGQSTDMHDESVHAAGRVVLDEKFRNFRNRFQEVICRSHSAFESRQPALYFPRCIVGAVERILHDILDEVASSF